MNTRLVWSFLGLPLLLTAACVMSTTRMVPCKDVETARDDRSVSYSFSTGSDGNHGRFSPMIYFIPEQRSGRMMLVISGNFSDSHDQPSRIDVRLYQPPEGGFNSGIQAAEVCDGGLCTRASLVGGIANFSHECESSLCALSVSGQMTVSGVFQEKPMVLDIKLDIAESLIQTTCEDRDSSS